MVVAIACSLLPGVALASGNADGYPTLLGLLAVPPLLLLAIGLGIGLAIKKAHVFVGVIGLVLASLAALWQGFWYLLEHEFPLGFASIGIVTNLSVFLLAVLQLQAGGKRARERAAHPPFR
jgi:hypothetical protein